MTLYTNIEIDENEIEVSVEFTVYAAEPVSRDMEYGGCGASVEFLSEFTDADGNVYYPSERELDRITEEAHEMAADMKYEKYND